MKEIHAFFITDKIYISMYKIFKISWKKFRIPHLFRASSKNQRESGR